MREKELVERAVKVIKHFIDVKSSGRLSKRAIPKNGYWGPAKLKEAVYLDTDYQLAINWPLLGLIRKGN